MESSFVALSRASLLLPALHERMRASGICACVVGGPCFGIRRRTRSSLSTGSSVVAGSGIGTIVPSSEPAADTSRRKPSAVQRPTSIGYRCSGNISVGCEQKLAVRAQHAVGITAEEPGIRDMLQHLGRQDPVEAGIVGGARPADLEDEVRDSTSGDREGRCAQHPGPWREEAIRGGAGAEVEPVTRRRGEPGRERVREILGSLRSTYAKSPGACRGVACRTPC